MPEKITIGSEVLEVVKPKEMFAMLEARVEEAGSQKALADEIGCAPQFISNILGKRLDPGPKVLKALGIKKIVMMVKI